MLLEAYYNINYLKINADKSKLLITCKPRYRTIIKDIKLTASTYIIDQSQKIKILGIFFNSGLDNTPNVTNIIKKVNYRMIVLNNIIKFTNIKTSLILYNSLVISVFNYCLSNIININVKQISNLNTLLMKCAHKILGFKSYRMNTINILKELNWLSMSQMITFSAIKLVHKITYESVPPALTQFFFYNMERSDVARLVRKPSPRYRYKSAKCKNSFIHRATYIYNQIPHELRTINIKKFAIEVKSYLFYNTDLKKIPKIDDNP